MKPASTISISFNGKPLMVPPNSSLDTLLEFTGTPQSPFALAVNNQFVPRGQYAATLLHQDDCIDLVMPVQGG